MVNVDRVVENYVAVWNESDADERRRRIRAVWTANGSTCFRLLDAQFQTEHLARFGAVAIPRAAYMRLLSDALQKDAAFYCPEPSGNSGSCSLAPVSGETILTGAVDATAGATWPGWFVLQLITQTS